MHASYGSKIHCANLRITSLTGAIVAIRDLNQQMYVSVKNTGNTYQVVGVYHYSLAGEHALFKVIAWYLYTGINFSI